MASNAFFRPCLRGVSCPPSSSISIPATALRSTATKNKSKVARIPQPAAAAATRALSTTASPRYKQLRVPDSDIPIPSVSGKTRVPGLEIPPYPFGRRQVYHQSNTGLYGSARIRFGNNVSEKNEVKTRRKWRPNVQQKRLWSASLGTLVRTRVTTRVLRTIDKLGGLDEYLLGSKTGRIRDLGPWGWMLRWRIMQTPAVRARFAAERAAMGLPPSEEESQVSAAAQMVADMKALGAPEDVTADEVIAETDRMLKEDREFGIGEEETLVEEVKDDAGFMNEVDPRKL